MGYLIAVAFVGWCTLLALMPWRPGGTLGRVSWFFGFMLNELPVVAFAWLVASTLLAIDQVDLTSLIGLAALGLAVLATAGLAVIVWRALRTRPAVEQAMEDGLGVGWRTRVDVGTAARLRTR